MVKPEMPNIPGMGAMTDSLEFVKTLWAGMGIPGAGTGTASPGTAVPGMVLPTLSVEEIRKKIADLKAVETWLDLNMNMLRGSIQALEVQAATLSTLQSMGEALSASMNAGAKGAADGKTPGTQPGNGAGTAAGSGTAQPSLDQFTAPLVNAAAWWNMLQDQFQQAVNNAAKNEQPKPQEAASANKAEKAPPEPPRRRKSSK